MLAPIKIVSSMATRQILAELVAAFEARTSLRATLESVGGVDAAKRVRAGEVIDAVVLASDVIDKLIEEGRIVAGTRVDLVRSGVAVAVRAGAPRPDIGSEDAVRSAVLARDFAALGPVVEVSTLAMHVSMLVARSALIYFAFATLRVIERVRALRA